MEHTKDTDALATATATATLTPAALDPHDVSSKLSKAVEEGILETDYSSKATSKTSFTDYLRVFSYSTSMERLVLGCAALGEVGIGATLPLMVIIFGNLTTNFQNYDPNLSGAKETFEKALNKQTLYLVYLFIARYVLSYFSMIAFRTAGLRMSAKVRLEYMTALFALPICVLDTLPGGQASNTITTTANVLQLGISEKLGTLIQFTSLAVTAIIIAFKYSWSLTLVTSSVLLFIALVYGTTLPLIIKMTKEVEHADEKASSIAGEVLGGIRMIVSQGAESRMATKYSGWVEESRRRGRKMDLLVGVQYSPLFFSIYSTMALAFWFGFRLYVQGHILNVGTIVIVLMSVMMLAFSVAQTAGPIMNVTKAASAATDFFAVIDAPKPEITGLKDPDVSPLDDIVLDSVTFAYPTRPHVKVLDNLSMRFESGKITAIVGASGSGKSTIVGLLERWYNLDKSGQYKLPESAIKDKKSEKVTEKEEENKKSAEALEELKPPVSVSGSIKVGTHNLDSVDLKWWRSQIGLVQQEPFIFNDSIYKNVENGLIGSQWENEDAATKKALVEEACKEAFADEFINRLPQGYDTQVGDAGIKLSGGQRQRLAIARSIIKRPKILILDEATSSIDVRGERLVQAALDKVSEGRTTITIAHRLSTIKKADKIVVLKKGNVIEEGTHESLLENEDGAYWALVNAQKLIMGETFADESDLIESSKTDDLIPTMSSISEEAKTTEETTSWKRKGFFNSFGRLLYEQSVQWPFYTLLLIGCIGAASAYPLQAWLFAKLLNVVVLPKDELPSQTSYWALRFFILGLGAAASYFILGSSSNAISVNISCTYRQQYFESILAKPVPFFDAEDNSTGTLTGRVANDPTQLQQLLGINMGMVYIAFLSIIGCIIIAFVFGWKLTVLAVFVALPVLLASGFYRIRYEVQFEKMNQAVFAESSKFAAEAISAFRTVNSLTLENMICHRYDMLLQAHVKKAFDKSKFTTLIFAASDSMQLPLMALAFWYGGRLIASGEYNPVQFFVIYMAVVNGAEGAGSLLSFGPNMAQASAAANRILSFRAPQQDAGKAVLELQDTKGALEIDLKDVWFKYPTRDIPVFKGLNLRIEKGKFVALVGASGCGKTSIISLLERFYDIQKGKISCNGINIAELDAREYRKAISLVAQEPTLFQGSIKENILLGVEETTPTETLHRACRDAEIHDFITSLPDGYNTDVGMKGIALSGGQKQRIAIARALIRDPKILLLDEATSSLDSESEKLVQAAFEKAGKGRTMVVVAHRLATVQNADVIFVLGEGKVLETGDHQTLLRNRGVYYQMCQSQALDK